MVHKYFDKKLKALKLMLVLISKKVYVNNLNDIVTDYNNALCATNKMKPFLKQIKKQQEIGNDFSVCVLNLQAV